MLDGRMDFGMMRKLLLRRERTKVSFFVPLCLCGEYQA